MDTPKMKTIEEIAEELREMKEQSKKSKDRMLKYSDNRLNEKKYKKYIIGKIIRDTKGVESIKYFSEPIEEFEYGTANNVDMSKLIVIRDLVVIYLSNKKGRYTLDPQLKTFVYLEEEITSKT